MLHSIREGVVGVDPGGRITIANDGARELLDLPEDCVGRPVDDLGLENDVVDVLSGRAAGVDVVVLHRDRVLVVEPADGPHRGPGGAAQRRRPSAP